jgi:hypothetical protein
MSSTKKMVVEWKGNLRLEGKNEKGLTVNFDAPIPHGGEEDYFYLIPETAQGIPNAKLILHKKFGHNVMFDNSRQFQDDILRFLNENNSEIKQSPQIELHRQATSVN